MQAPPPPPPPNQNYGYHMTPDEFRKWGYAMVDWIAQYQTDCGKYPVHSTVKPGEIRSKLPEHPPSQPEPFQNVMDDINKVVMPGITHWQSPNFFAYFPANSSGPSVLADLLCSGLGVQGMLWSTSPSCTEVETHVMDWLVDILGLPGSFKSSSAGGGALQDTASSSALVSLCCARERATSFKGIENGLCSLPVLTAYCSVHTHSSIDKAMMVSGIGKANLRKISADPTTQAMNTEELEKAIIHDKEQGRLPFFICATIGTTSSNAIDPVRKIGEVAKKYGLWLHVDSAMSGSAAVCPEFRWINDGVELADSYCFNPHKWLFTNFDCSCLFVATESGAVIDYRDWQVPLGRRFRSLKLWFVLRHYGQEGLQYHIREHVRLAQTFASWVRESDKFELVCEPPLNLVCFRLKSGNDALAEKIMDSINDEGHMYLTHTKLGEKFILRMCIGCTNTREEHVKAAWNNLVAAAKKFEP